MREIERYRPYTSYTSHQPSYHQAPLRRPRRKLPLIVLSIALLLLIGYLVLHPDSAKPGKSVAATTHKQQDTVKTAKAIVTPTDPALTTMSQTINNVVNQNSEYDFSVSLINLTNGQSEHYGSGATYQAASTAKIIAAVDWLHQVEIGQEEMDETVGPDTAANDIDQMITVSNDPDWKAIEADLGYNNLQNYATNLGLVNYEAFNNSLTSGDIALILQKLWDGSVLNQADTQLLLSYMQQANYRQYIVPAIPSEDTIYHKIGFYEDYLNDAAIVAHGKQAFVIVIFTNGNGAGNWPARAILMQDIAKAALQYYFNQ